ncbi:hypothetical protein Q4485_01455 [Granulosicoccaceae sp. 1_MG-2023]|nr:hypothetical protein [Granulosicoccaceae sp. 1_MG-2023]
MLARTAIPAIVFSGTLDVSACFSLSGQVQAWLIPDEDYTPAQFRLVASDNTTSLEVLAFRR